ncbi:uncharacterized protein V1510DRAFT_374331 [Dipodascopsis tothii]|uniref:uncharacterized protein n=1 Tax=Dipodascopsis tothii TaxID=44089 RepID=UPI0034CD5FFC
MIPDTATVAGGPLSPMTASQANAGSRPSSVYGLDNDLAALKLSSVNHMRTLASSSRDVDRLTIPGVTTGAQDVAGVQGRIRLQKKAESASSFMARNWMDKQRKVLAAYEYLCHIGEAKEWIERCIGEEIPAVIELEEALRNGVILAQLSKEFAPQLVKRIFRADRLQWLHSNNIHIFFRFLDEVELPELFRFEFTDLYDKKNIPKVIYCIHALAYVLSAEGLAPEIGNLVGKLHFTDDEIRDTQRGLDAAGISLPNFKGMNKHFDDEPAETDDERVARELAEAEPCVAALQDAARGALARRRLRTAAAALGESAGGVVALQSAVRARRVRAWARERRARVAREAWAVAVQAAARRFMVQRALQAKLRRLHEQAPRTVDLQARARAGPVRQRLRDRAAALRAAAPALVRLQSVVRGSAVRQRLRGAVGDIFHADLETIELQQFVRGFLARRRLLRLRQKLAEAANKPRPLVELQSLVRGRAARRGYYDTRLGLHEATALLDQFKAQLRGAFVRIGIAVALSDLRDGEAVVVALQARCRGALARRALGRAADGLERAAAATVALQAEIRGARARERCNALADALQDCEADTVELQAQCRGALLRLRYGQRFAVLVGQEDASLRVLQRHARGYIIRSQVAELLAELGAREHYVVRLQSTIRGALVRVDLRSLETELDEAGGAVGALQARARGFLRRSDYRRKQEFFAKNMDNVIKIQSIIRAKQQGDAYRALTTGQNPKLGMVKSFVHLLNDSDLDFEEEMEFEELRGQVVEEVHKNEQLEQYIKLLDVKIALLVKNKITLDEVIKHQKGGMVKGRLIGDGGSGGPFDLKSLNKTSRRRLDLYQGLFFILQTQPYYLARLFRATRDAGVGETETKQLEACTVALFGHVQKRREEFHLLKLVVESMREDMAYMDTLPEILLPGYMWSKLFVYYTRRLDERQFVKDLVGPMIKAVLSDDELDLETDPMTIYHTSINNEELVTGKRSARNHSAVVEEAIKDPESRTIFIKNLQSLREFAIQFLDTLDEKVEHVPYGVRYFAREVYRGLKSTFKVDEEAIVSVVWSIVFSRYINPAIAAPELYGLYDRPLNQIQKKNLTEVSRILMQIAAGRLFGKDNIYLQPLNVYIKTFIANMREDFAQLIKVPDPEAHYEMDDFDDLTATHRPTLAIKMSNIYAIHATVARFLEQMATESQDPLRDAVKELGPLPSDESELMNVSRNTEVKLELNPVFIQVRDPEAEVNQLMMEVKRCLLYVIRVQTGDNLLDILVKPVAPEDEDKFAQIVRAERESKTGKAGAYREGYFGDITQLSYKDLKVLTLERVIDLERKGRISRDNKYQDLLNSIAVDIRTKRNRRLRRQKELEGVRQTLSDLGQKEAYLQIQLHSYNDYIEQAMSTLQAKKGGRKRPALPFTKQYFHVRGLVKAGKMPKFGSFKYSAAKLFEKGVLTELKGLIDRQNDKIDFTFSSDQVGVFFIETSMSLMLGKKAEITLDELLERQFNNYQSVYLFENSAVFNTNLLLHLIFKKFYRDA